MCGRFGQFNAPELMAEVLNLKERPVVTPRYNVAPGQSVAFIRRPSDSQGLEMALLRWGLIPAWLNIPPQAARMINVRLETARQKPAFKRALKERRGLFPVDGFYEWSKRGRTKKPYYFHLKDGAPLALAGLWEKWIGSEGETIQSCAILTTSSNDLVKPIHDRMPVILTGDVVGLWLNYEYSLDDLLNALTESPFPAESMQVRPVSSYVNKPENEGPRCLEPWSEDQFSFPILG
ncbi:MAG: SOS response-associated peptidase [Thermodesulfobacteriota bacterium]